MRIEVSHTIAIVMRRWWCSTSHVARCIKEKHRRSTCCFGSSTESPCIIETVRTCGGILVRSCYPHLCGEMIDCCPASRRKKHTCTNEHAEARCRRGEEHGRRKRFVGEGNQPLLGRWLPRCLSSILSQARAQIRGELRQLADVIIANVSHHLHDFTGAVGHNAKPITSVRTEDVARNRSDAKTIGLSRRSNVSLKPCHVVYSSETNVVGRRTLLFAGLCPFSPRSARELQVMAEGKSEEHSLEYQELFNEYLLIFEGKLEEFIGE